MRKRLFDIVVSASLLLFALPLLGVVAMLVRLTSPGPALHWSRRIGQDNKLFGMAKFRTMRVDTPNVATHLLDDPAMWLTPVGSFLRRTSLDEVPQLWHVLRGQMSLVGPRPALFNQDDLMQLRTDAGVHVLRPGITGLAQVEGRDDLSIPDKVALDLRYLHSAGFRTDIELLARTVAPVLLQRSIRVD